MADITRIPTLVNFYEITYLDGLKLRFPMSAHRKEIEEHCTRKNASFKIMSDIVHYANDISDSLTYGLLKNAMPNQPVPSWLIDECVPMNDNPGMYRIVMACLRRIDEQGFIITEELFSEIKSNPRQFITSFNK